MILFRYDKTFEGLLTAVFDAYNRNTFPEKLLRFDDIEPLFVTETYTVLTQEDKSARVWKGLVFLFFRSLASKCGNTLFR